MTTRILTVVSFLALSIFLATAQATDERPPTNRSVANEGLKWLTGAWAANLEAGAVIEETWTFRDGVLSGFCRELAGGRTRLLEIMTIEPGPAGLEMRLRHFGPGLQSAWEEKDAPMVFRLDRVDRQEAVFVGTGPRQGERLVYRRQGGRALRFRGEFLHEGKPVVVEFEMRRQ